MMTERFPSLSISVTNLSCLVKDVFPDVSVKRLGKKRVSCIVGIELRQPLSLDSTTDSASCPFSVVATGTATPTIPSSATGQHQDLSITYVRSFAVTRWTKRGSVADKLIASMLTCWPIYASCATTVHPILSLMRAPRSVSVQQLNSFCRGA